MQLPLPNLDTRRWQDLVDEGRALIPLHAPEWTDHNLSDPGITLMELLAFLTEQLIYRSNQVPERHRRKFLALLGYPALPPQPASGVLALGLQPGQAAIALPAGLALEARLPLSGQQAGPGVLFRTRRNLLVSPAAITAVQVFDGARFTDLTATWREGEVFAAWGDNPMPAAREDSQPALYIGFDRGLPVGSPIGLWLEFANAGSGRADRERLLVETTDAAAACAPGTPGWPCPPGGLRSRTRLPDTDTPPHHSVRTAWEYHDGARWQTLDASAGAVVDDSRSCTLSGRVQITVPSAMAAAVRGARTTPCYYLRCRMLSGPPDAAPRLKALFTNAVEIEQAQAARSPLQIRAGTVPPAGQEPRPGRTARIDLALDANGFITVVAFGGTASGPEVLVVDYTPATAAAPGGLVITLVPIGVATGYPQQEYSLPQAPVSGYTLRLWTLEAGTWERWTLVPDLDSCAREARAFTLDSMRGVVRFGDGLHGLVPLAGVPVFAAFDVTNAADGDLPAGVTWRLAGADDLLNGALLGGAFPAVVNGLSTVENPVPATGGAGEEDLSHAAGRAATSLYAHERLVELSEDLEVDSLDQVDPGRKLALASPRRAATLLDYDRCALDVPGTRVARTRSWVGLDSSFPCLQAPGTVSVVILPELPAGRPQPTTGLLQAVRRYLARRKVAGTRLVVTGPSYHEVLVDATIQGSPGIDPVQVRSQVIQRLNEFLDPISGGPDRLGWPFGRDVYRSEILQVIDDVPGVDHVVTLALRTNTGEPQCDNLCVGPLELVTAGAHSITVV